MNKSTLSRKLFIRIAPIIFLVIALIGGLAFYSADKAINTVYDAQLISDANILFTLISDEIDETGDNFPKKINYIDLMIENQLALNDSADSYANSRMFRVWKSDNIILYSDTALPDTIPQQTGRFSTIKYKGEEWRIYVLPVSDKPVSIEVGEKLDLRYRLVTNILWNLAVPLLMLVPMVGIFIWFGIGSGLGTIRNLVEQISTRSPDDLSHINTGTLPQDLAPLGKSLNNLFTKLDNSFTAERRFTDHAAHQLRTPQATIKLQLQMLAKAKTEEEKNTLIQELMQSNERASKLVGMLLTSARISYQPIHLQLVPIYNSIALVMAELGLLAKEKNIEMSLEGDENANALADEILFKLMINNIIENAIKYSPAYGNVQVKIESQAENCKISVRDTGYGIPEEEQKMVFERFYRIATPATEGSGLGLAIVAEIIKRFSGSVSLKNPESGTGLLVEIILPNK